MPHVVDTDRMLSEGHLSEAQVDLIKSRSRELMVSLGINTLLTAGIIAATLGFIAWLGTPLSVAITGIPLLIAGILVLIRGGELYRMFGHAATLIGGGMLLGGAMVELLDKLPDHGPIYVLVLGGLVALGCGLLWSRRAEALGFTIGAGVAAGTAVHLIGVYAWAEDAELSRAIVPLIHFYAALVTAFVGWRLDVRLITALAVVPFAQMLDTGTTYWGAAYVFYSPESTLTILQMGLLIGVCVWAARHLADREARHAMILAILAAVVANLSFLVGSLWGDMPGAHVFGPLRSDFESWDRFRAAQEAFDARLIEIHEHVYSIVWAIILIAAAAWAAHTARRGLFNTAMTFGAIHAYTQAFETFSDEPLAYVIGGLAAVPLAWGLWRLNQRWEEPQGVAS